MDSIIQEIDDFTSGNVENIPDSIKESVSKWLGQDLTSKSDYKKIAKDLAKIRDSISAMDIKDFRYDDDTTAYAYVFPFFKKMYLGAAFFSASDTGNDTKSGILVHETSHKFGVLRTRDYVYGTSKAESLANTKPGKAIRNADNWEYFFENLRTGGR